MKRFRGLLIVVAIVAAWTIAGRLMHRRAVPPANVTSFATFTKWQRSPRRIRVIERSGIDYLVATGPAGALLPRGRPFMCLIARGDWSIGQGIWATTRAFSKSGSRPPGSLGRLWTWTARRNGSTALLQPGSPH